MGRVFQQNEASQNQASLRNDPLLQPDVWQGIHRVKSEQLCQVEKETGNELNGWLHNYIVVRNYARGLLDPSNKAQHEFTAESCQQLDLATEQDSKSNGHEQL